jgi:hypothetical protein
LDPAIGRITNRAAGPIRTITETVHAFGQSRVVLQTIAYSGTAVSNSACAFIGWKSDGG